MSKVFFCCFLRFSFLHFACYTFSISTVLSASRNLACGAIKCEEIRLEVEGKKLFYDRLKMIIPRLRHTIITASDDWKVDSKKKGFINSRECFVQNHFGTLRDQLMEEVFFSVATSAS